MDENDLTRLIRTGEGETVEFKSNAHSVATTACAMANTSGGTIIIGITDDGVIKGVDKKVEERISTALQGLSPSPAMRLHKISIEKRNVIVAVVERSDSIVSIGPLAYIRIGRSNRPLSITELVQRSVQLGLIQFDVNPSRAPASEMSREMLAAYLKERERSRGVARKGSLEENAKRLKVLVRDRGRTRMSYAGLLCFSRRPQDRMVAAGIRILELDADGRTVSTTEFDGPVWRMAEAVVSHLTGSLGHLDIRVGAKRRPILEYPEWAVREAVVNAVAHRNYALDSDIRIFRQPGKLTIRSPGGFPQGVSPEHPDHRPVNPLVCQYLYDLGLIERYGFGITRMVAEARSHPFCELEFDISPSRVDVIFSRTTKKGLDELDQKLMAVLSDGPESSSVLSDAIGLSKVATVARLKGLMNLGLVDRTGKGSSTRYSRRKER